MPRTGTALLYLGLVLHGLVTVFLGPLLPELQEVWGAGESEIASLFVAQFVASSVGAVLSSARRRLSLIAGYGAIAAGLLGLAWSGQETGVGWTLPWTFMATIGLGIGLVAPATNLTVAHMNPSRRGAALATLNLMWGIGAVSCQLLFAAVRGRLPAVDVLWPLAALSGLVALSMAWKLGTVDPVVDPEASPADPEGEPGRRGLALQLVVAGMMFSYVGTETATGGWLVALADQLRSERTAASVLVNACFWGALLAGRASASAVLARWKEAVLFKVSLAIAAGGALVILWAPSPSMLAAGASLAGLGLSPLFPLTVSLLAASTAASGSRGTGWVFAFTGFGGAFVPWLTGQVAEGAASLRTGFLVPMGSLVLLAVLFGLGRLSRDSLRT